MEVGRRGVGRWRVGVGRDGSSGVVLWNVFGASRDFLQGVAGVGVPGERWAVVVVEVLEVKSAQGPPPPAHSAGPWRFSRRWRPRAGGGRGANVTIPAARCGRRRRATFCRRRRRGGGGWSIPSPNGAGSQPQVRWIAICAHLGRSNKHWRWGGGSGRGRSGGETRRLLVSEYECIVVLRTAVDTARRLTVAGYVNRLVGRRGERRKCCGGTRSGAHCCTRVCRVIVIFRLECAGYWAAVQWVGVGILWIGSGSGVGVASAILRGVKPTFSKIASSDQ